MIGRWSLRLVAAAAWALALAGGAAVVASRREVRLSPLPWVGNRTEVLARLPGMGAAHPFRILVAGDPEDGPSHLVELLSRFKDAPPAFVVLTGDVVKSPTPERYAHFLDRMREVGWEVPTFCAVGNSDCPPAPDGLFERSIGPRVFRFEFAGCLFAFFDDAHGAVDDAQIRPVDELLSRDRARFRHVFFVLHRPPVEVKCESEEEEAGKRIEHSGLLALVRRRSVDYVLCGHLHGYARVEREGTRYIVTGGGGGRLQQDAAGYHLVELRVEPDGDVREDVVTTGREAQPAEVLRTDWEVKVVPWARAHVAASIGAEAAIVVAALGLTWAAWSLAGRRVAGRSAP